MRMNDKFLLSVKHMLKTIEINDGIKSSLLFDKLKITHREYIKYLAYLEFLELIKVIGKYDQIFITDEGDLILDTFNSMQPKDFNYP